MQARAGPFILRAGPRGAIVMDIGNAVWRRAGFPTKCLIYNIKAEETGMGREEAMERGVGCVGWVGSRPKTEVGRACTLSTRLTGTEVCCLNYLPAPLTHFFAYLPADIHRRDESSFQFWSQAWRDDVDYTPWAE